MMGLRSTLCLSTPSADNRFAFTAVRAQLRLLDLWKDKRMVSRRLLAYDTTNFYTYIASNNTRNDLAQRGHNSLSWFPAEGEPTSATSVAGRAIPNSTAHSQRRTARFLMDSPRHQVKEAPHPVL
jgi:hypothetical protein